MFGSNLKNLSRKFFFYLQLKKSKIKEMKKKSLNNIKTYFMKNQDIILLENNINHILVPHLSA
jgi:hypothetical protein